MNEQTGWLPLLWLLLPVAALSGWFAARRSRGPSARRRPARVPPEYFRGLNYLLNEQPDKAIEEFVRMAEVDDETVETHLALGSLFRRRGEVDRAIRIHQNLMARGSLTREQRLLAMLELGMDYMRSGLLDRAEGLFRELVEVGSHTRQALEQLLDIYQQERDWPNAIAAAQRLRATGVARLDPAIAHFHCELAEQALRAGSRSEARQQLAQALARDPRCVRASLIEARMEEEEGNPRAAIAAYARIEAQDADFLPEAIRPLQRCHEIAGTAGEFDAFLAGMVERHGGTRAQLMHADLVAARNGDAAAMAFLSRELRHQPTVPGISRLLDLIRRSAGDRVPDSIAVVHEAVERLEREQPVYRCIRCGFAARLLHWQCPGCKQWSTVKPVHGVERG
jgi:lipopolysaccharide biosynthesis regulator YciM